MSSKRLVAAVVLLAVGACLSTLLLFEHRGQPIGAVARLCGAAGATSGCETVSRSAYAAPLGVPLAAVGLVFFVALALLLVLSLADPAQAPAAARLAFLLVALALLGDLALLALQAFSIGAYCTLCLLSYVVNAGVLALLWPARSLPLGPLFAPPARSLRWGALLAGAMAVVAVAAADRALLARQPSSDAALGFAGTLGEAQARIRTLQETLDNPQKLQQYLSDKAMATFDAAPVQQIDLVSPAVLGPRQAPLQVVTYSDFLCPHCRSLANGLHGLLPRTNGRLSIVFKHYPLDQDCNTALPRMVHPGACWLARGAVCAQEQGRFEAFHDKVFGGESKGASDEAEVRRLAQEAGLDALRLSACLTAPQSLARVSADIEEGRRVGVQGTPTVLINGKLLPSLDLFGRILEREAQRLGQPLIAQVAGAAH